MNILITGGAGYIGRYITDILVEDHDVIVVDDLSTGHIDGVNKNAKFYKMDIRDKEGLNKVFQKSNIEVVIHMAAKLDVEESSRKPNEYYDVNVNGTIVLLEVMKKNNVNNIVFSSTAAVYGEVDNDTKIDENFTTNPVNVYGKSKLYGENIIEDCAIAYGLNYVIFRYFNVAGGRKIGYSLEDNKTLIPRVVSAVANNKSVSVFGNDYPTRDGSCIRDFIHVIDLANAHVLATEKMIKNRTISGIYNLGSSEGYSVYEIIEATEKVLAVAVRYQNGERRVGDACYSVAASDKANKKLGWSTEYNDINLIIKDVYDNNY